MFQLASVLLLLLFTYQFTTQVADASSIILRAEAPQRTLFNIIWGCLSTTIICVWSAIHPNIPPREGPFKATLRRLDLMIWAILAPEAMPAVALNQRLAAMTVRDVYNNNKQSVFLPPYSEYVHETRPGCKTTCGIWESVKEWFSLSEMKRDENRAWTLAHGHFVVMGGIHLVEAVEGNSTQGRQQPGAALVTTPLVEDAEKGRTSAENKPEGVTILTLEMLRELVKDPEFEIHIKEDEITDKSKGDALSKTVLILQSSWFILMCIARVVQGLSLTQLELTTTALASLNGITFILWWDKPLGVRSAVRVYLKKRLTDEERDVGRKERLSNTALGRAQVRPYLRGAVNAIRCQIKSLWQSKVAWPLVLPLAIVALLLFPIGALLALGFCSLVDATNETATSFPIDATHVPSLYVPKHDYDRDRDSMPWHVYLMMALGTIFGGIHCAGWNYPFSTYTEQKLWRIASLAVTIVPAVLLIIFTVTKRRTPYTAVMIVAAIFMLIHSSARLILIAQAIVLLKHLPPSSLIAVDWIKFYPHLF